MRLSELFRGAGLAFPKEYGNIEVGEIVTDSRKVTEGCIYICIKGHNYDGHDHISEAIRNGAAVIVAEQLRDECVGGAAIIIVENTRRASSLLYNSRFGRPTDRLKIVGVTGTNGKTSVCYMLRSIFRAAGYKVGLIGTVESLSEDRTLISSNNNTDAVRGSMTTPDPDVLYRLLAQMAGDGVEYVFMEVTSHALLQHRVDAIEFEAAVFTNLTRDHLDLHGDMDSYFQAKARLFQISKKGVVNIDSDYGEKMLMTASCPIFSCSVRGKGDFYSLLEESDSRGERGIRYSFLEKESADGHSGVEVSSRLCGSFSVYNTLEALAVARLEGIPACTAAEALRRFEGVPGRMERVDIPEESDLDVFIDYAHTPDALEQLIRGTREWSGGRCLTVVFGCGGERDRGKRKEMGRIASRLADLTVITSDNSRGEHPEEIFSEILKGIDKEKAYLVIPSREDAIRCAIEYARENEVILLAGKGHERYEIDAKGKHPFDEREIARSSLIKRYKRMCEKEERT